jgi:hypothetical protein
MELSGRFTHTFVTVVDSRGLGGPARDARECLTCELPLDRECRAVFHTANQPPSPFLPCMRHLATLLCLAAGLALFPPATVAADKPTGRFLFQPMFIWSTSEVTHQGTGFLLKDGTRTFGATSVHFMDFDAGGLFEAIWLDITNEKVVTSFRTSLGKPERTAIDRIGDIQHDFVLMPAESLPANCAALEVEDVADYKAGTKLWFPNKNPESPDGYTWVEAEVIDDKKVLTTVKFLSEVELESQSGTPFINQDTGKVIGLLMGGDAKEIILCPARSLAKRLKSTDAVVTPLMESIKK